MGTQGDRERGVQLHFDLILPNGLFVYMVRGLVPEDSEKYPQDGYAQRPEGLIVSIMGVGLYQRNTWKMADLEVCASP